jgi:hypothetical protein
MNLGLNPPVEEGGGDNWWKSASGIRAANY